MKKYYIFIIGFLLWPIIIATPFVVNAYVSKLSTLEIEYGQIPESDLILGLLSGFFASFIFIGLSYLISNIIYFFNKSTKIVGSKIYLILTILSFLLLTISYGGKTYDALTLEKDNVEAIQNRIKLMR